MRISLPEDILDLKHNLVYLYFGVFYNNTQL